MTCDPTITIVPATRHQDCDAGGGDTVVEDVSVLTPAFSPSSRSREAACGAEPIGI